MTTLRSFAPLLLLLTVLVGCGSNSAVSPTPAPTTASKDATATREPSAAATGDRTPAATAGTTATPSPGAAVISLEFAAEDAPSPGQEFNLTVQLDPRGRGISGMQFDLLYPAESVQVLDIVPGPLTGDAPVQIERPAGEPGDFIYALARRGETQAPTPAGLVATLKLKVLEDVAAGATLQLRLERVTIADAEIQAVNDIELGLPVNLVVADS